MLYLIGLILVVGLVYAPQFWVQYVLRKYHKTIDNMPGTGGELAQHLIERFELPGVTLEEGQESADHYDPAARVVSLSPEVYHGKSLSAVAVAAHEVGHAIQFSREEPVSKLREKYLGKARLIQTCGIYIISITPIIGLVLRIPHLALFTAAVGVITMLMSVLMYVAVLPEEYDASFNKALPILAEGYVPEEQMPAVRQVLKAAALTYVAAALSDVLSLWRWAAILR